MDIDALAEALGLDVPAPEGEQLAVAEGERLEPAVEALLRAESWRAPAPAPRHPRCRSRGPRWHQAQSIRR